MSAMPPRPATFEIDLDAAADNVRAVRRLVGPERTIFASNWPFGRLFASYPDVIGAWATLIEDFSLDERTAMFSANAERYFRI